jgi:hypothetical protein
VVVGFTALAAVLHFASPNVADGDSFFYIKQAFRVRTGAFFDTSFPWMQFSIIRELGVSLWYGFSVALVPFTFIPDLVLGIKIAGVAFTALTLAAFWWVMRRHGFAWPVLWPFLYLFSAPNVLFRFLMVRPQLISLGLGAVLFSLLTRGGFWFVLIVSSLIVWVHMNFAWLPLLLASAVAAARLLAERRFEWVGIAGAALGTVLGWLLRPHPIAAAKLFYVQIIEHSVAKASGLPILFGAEHQPLLLTTLVRNFGIFGALLTAAIGVCIWLALRKSYGGVSPEGKTVLWSSLALSIVFFVLTMLFSRRAYDLWVGFGVIFIAQVFTALKRSEGGRGREPAAAAGAALLVLLVASGLYSASKTRASIDANGYRPDQERAVSEWLGEHGDPGDVVLNVRWSRFQQLFLWNEESYYAAGLDPIFQYAYDPELYWKYHYLAEDNDVVRLGKTCGAPECTEGMLEGIGDVVRDDFEARFVLVEPLVNPNVYEFLSRDAGFKKAFETGGEAVFEVTP